MVYCDICATKEELDDVHKTTDKHKFNQRLKNYNHAKGKLYKNRHGVELSVAVVPLNGFQYNFFAEPDKKGRHYLNITPEKFRKHQNKIEFSCKIQNKRAKNQDPVVITYCGVLHPYKPYTMYDLNNNDLNQKKLLLRSGLVYEVKVKLELPDNHVSNYSIPVYFDIQTYNAKNEPMESFTIIRSIVVAIHDEKLEEVALEKSPFTSNKWEKVTTVLPKKIFNYEDRFPIPKQYWKTLFFGLTKDFGDGVLQEIRRKLQPEYVTVENYKHFFHILLWLEEICAIVGLCCYNMENVYLTYKPGDVLELVVPGLAEKRPSIIRGDYIDIKVHGDHTAYRGIIQVVGDKTVEIHHLDDIIVDMVKNHKVEMDVRFKLGRIHFERMHQGIEQVVINGYVKNLFPNERLLLRSVHQSINISQSQLHNKQVYNNKEQMTAVLKIVNNTSRPAPYIVFGPPGTGKTVTIVEAIYQLKKHTNNKILVCAPANAACNMLTEKLAEFCTEKELRRIMSENCDTSSIHNNIIPYCNVYRDNQGDLVVPFPKYDLNKFRIIVTTLVFAGKFTREYHPDVVFIDEAAQAREPEACCAMGLLMNTKQLILAGDPKQLGPVVHSDICIQYKYHISLLDRLMDLKLYKNDTRNNFMTMLKLNFRSHPKILELPNKFFYDNHLKAVSASALTDPLTKIFVYKLIVDINKKIQPGGPVEFCSVLSKERREGRSPSYYNPREVEMVYKYIEALTSIKFNDEVYQVTPDQIGVVTPYIRQVYKIREKLKAHFKDVEVGTTEAFQGREKRIMIISTVRAQEDLLLYDKMYKLGFVGEDKRFNVAITRGKSKVIVIGCPLVLEKDEKFSDLIQSCMADGTFCGASYQRRNCEIRQHITNRINRVKLTDSQYKHQRYQNSRSNCKLKILGNYMGIFP